MKKRFPVYAAAVFAALSCSSMSQLQTQVYDDGVYSRPAPVKAAQAVTDEEVDNLLADSHASQAYIIGADTLIVPAGTPVRINTQDFSVIDVTPGWAYDYSWRYSPWTYDDWRLRHVYSPWYYNSYW